MLYYVPDAYDRLVQLGECASMYVEVKSMSPVVIKKKVYLILIKQISPLFFLFFCFFVFVFG